MTEVGTGAGGPVVLFDGVCNLCNAAVQWLVARDADGRFQMASLQSDAARRILGERLSPEEIDALPDAIVLVDDRGVHTRSTAFLRITRRLGFPSSLLAVGLIVPRRLRDAVYRLVARHRYRWFGRRQSCMVPTPEIAGRFLDADEPRPVLEGEDPLERDPGPARPWISAWAKRFAIAYVLVYMAPFPLTLLWTLFQLPYVSDIPGLGAVFGAVVGVHGQIVGPVVSWLGGALFGVDAAPQATGSGDQTFNYVDGLFDVLLALSISVAWTFAVRARKLSERGFDAAHVLARYYLATTMLSYGWIKLFPLQFPLPGPDRLLQPYGDSSPMGLAWTFLGASMGYQMFAGLSELVGGYLLFWRRTALAGALVSAAVMANVMAINYFYDVPVKLFSTHLFLAALFIMAPDAPRLVGMLGFGLPVARRVQRPFWWRTGRRVALVAVAHLLFVGAVTTTHVRNNSQRARATRGFTEPLPISGIYRVTSFVRNGVVDRENEDADRWVRVGLNAPGYATVQRANGEAVRMRLALDQDGGTMSFYDRAAQPPETPIFTLTHPEPDALELRGRFEGADLEVIMHKVDTDPLLTGRGFHWINEYPYNR